MSVERINNEIKHLEYLQKKGVSKSARRQIVGVLADKIIEYNGELEKAKDQEAKKRIFEKNLDLSKETFDKEVRNKKII